MAIIGVNTYLNPNLGQQTLCSDAPLTRASYDEKDQQLSRLMKFHHSHTESSALALAKLAEVAIRGGNIFAELMHTVRHASLGEISETLYKVGGRYRRSM